MEKEQNSFLEFLYCDQSGQYIGYLSVDSLNDLIDICLKKIKYYQSICCNNSFSDRIMLRMECRENTDQFFFPVAISRDVNKQNKISLHGYVLDCQIDGYSSDFIFCVMVGNKYINTNNIHQKRFSRREFQDLASKNEFHILNILHYKFFAIEIDDIKLPQKEYLINFPNSELKSMKIMVKFKIRSSCELHECNFSAYEVKELQLLQMIGMIIPISSLSNEDPYVGFIRIISIDNMKSVIEVISNKKYWKIGDFIGRETFIHNDYYPYDHIVGKLKTIYAEIINICDDCQTG